MISPKYMLPLAVALAAAGLGAWFNLERTEPDTVQGDTGALLAAVTLEDAQGAPFAFSQLAGRPTVLNFWATWCPPCVKEMPELSALSEKHGKRASFVGVAIDSPSAVRDFALKTPVAYPLVVGGLGGTELVRRFGNTSGGLPYTVLLDGQGRVVWQHLGVVDAAELDRRLLALAVPAAR